MSAEARSIPILTFHSISPREGPTNIPVEIFRQQMDILARSSGTVLSLDEYLGWLAGEKEYPKGSVVITFDDAFTDFADTAYPILAAHGFPSSVFVPVASTGRTESWAGAEEPPRTLMDMERIRDLSDKGVIFGAHSMTHPVLTDLDDGELNREVIMSGQVLSEKIGTPVRYFAPPYGASNTRVRKVIKQTYDLSFGVRLGVSGRHSSRYDLPRVEMHYFRDPGHWEAFLRKGDTLYFRARQLARTARLAGLSAVQLLRSARRI